MLRNYSICSVAMRKETYSAKLCLIHVLRNLMLDMYHYKIGYYLSFASVSLSTFSSLFMSASFETFANLVKNSFTAAFTSLCTAADVK